MRVPAYPTETSHVEDAFTLLPSLSSNFSFALPGELIVPPDPIMVQVPLVLTHFCLKQNGTACPHLAAAPWVGFGCSSLDQCTELFVPHHVKARTRQPVYPRAEGC